MGIIKGAIQDITDGWDIQVPSQVPIDAAFTLEESVYFFKKKDYFTWREAAVPHISPSEKIFTLVKGAPPEITTGFTFPDDRGVPDGFVFSQGEQVLEGKKKYQWSFDHGTICKRSFEDFLGCPKKVAAAGFCLNRSSASAPLLGLAVALLCYIIFSNVAFFIR